MIGPVTREEFEALSARLEKVERALSIRGTEEPVRILPRKTAPNSGSPLAEKRPGEFYETHELEME